jgi:hypothetical protein
MTMDTVCEALTSATHKWSDEEIEFIAKICHETNRGLCVANGDFSQRAWEDAPDWQKDSACDGVRKHLEFHCSPNDSHEFWMERKLKEGWRYGETKDIAAKTHPCLLPRRFLSTVDKIKDDVFSAIVRGFKQDKQKSRHSEDPQPE